MTPEEIRDCKWSTLNKDEFLVMLTQFIEMQSKLTVSIVEKLEELQRKQEFILENGQGVTETILTTTADDIKTISRSGITLKELHEDLQANNPKFLERMDKIRATKKRIPLDEVIESKCEHGFQVGSAGSKCACKLI